MQIWLARHGETDWNARRWVQGQSDIPLNAAGEAQARQLGERLAREASIQRVYSSGMRRARATARIAAETLGVPWVVREGLQEIGPGRMGRPYVGGDPKKVARGAQIVGVSKRDVRPPGGETYRELLGRFVPAIVRIVRESEGDALVVTHSSCMISFWRS